MNVFTVTIMVKKGGGIAYAEKGRKHLQEEGRALGRPDQNRGRMGVGRDVISKNTRMEKHTMELFMQETIGM